MTSKTNAARQSKSVSVTLTPDQAQEVSDRVDSGEYPSEEEVLRAGLDALAREDEALEDWLRSEIPRRLAALKADPSQAIPADEMFERLRERVRRRAAR